MNSLALAAWINYKEAWQMALDFNQTSEVRREWERRRDEMEAACLLALDLTPTGCCARIPQ